jgi:hypothetical protein
MTIGILTVEQDGMDGLIVGFTDGTVSAFLAEELLKLRPYRELPHRPGEQCPERNPKAWD